MAEKTKVKGQVKGRVQGSKNVSEADFVNAYVAGDSYESVGATLGLKPDTVMNRAASIRKKLIEQGKDAEAVKNSKLGPKLKTRVSVGSAAAAILGL